MDMGDKAALRSQLLDARLKRVMLNLYDNALSNNKNEYRDQITQLKELVLMLREHDKVFDMAKAQRLYGVICNFLQKSEGEGLTTEQKARLKSLGYIPFCREAVQFLQELLAKSIQCNDRREEVKQSEDAVAVANVTLGAKAELLSWYVTSSLLFMAKPPYPAELLGPRGCVPILREFLCAKPGDEMHAASIASELDSYIKSQEQSLEAMVSKLKGLHESIARISKTVDTLSSQNQAALNQAVVRAKVIRNAQEHMRSVKMKITGTCNADLNRVSSIRDQLLSADILPWYSLSTGSKKQIDIDENIVDFFAYVNGFTKNLEQSDTEELSADLKSAHEDFKNEYSIAAALVEDLKSTENDLKTAELKLRKVADTWMQQPAQWCLGDTVVLGRTLPEWTRMVTESAEVSKILQLKDVDE